MRRTQILSRFLLMWLIWVAFQQHYAISSSFQEPRSGAATLWTSVTVSSKINPAAYNSRVTGGHSRKTMRDTGEANEKKVRKTPSGPSPVGNHRPPSRG